MKKRCWGARSKASTISCGLSREDCIVQRSEEGGIAEFGLLNVSSPKAISKENCIYVSMYVIFDIAGHE